FDLEWPLRPLVLTEKLALEPAGRHPIDPDKGEPDPFLDIDGPGSAEPATEAHSPAEITQPTFGPAAREGHPSTHWQRSHGPSTAGQGLILPGTAKPDTVWIDNGHPSFVRGRATC